jgi:hypothetical protein
MSFGMNSNLPHCPWHVGQGANYFGSTLFVIGEFGGNDYLSFISSNRTVEQTGAYVPIIIDSISKGMEVTMSYTGWIYFFQKWKTRYLH